MENAKMLILNNKQDKSFKAVLNLKLDSPSLIKFYNLAQSRRSLALGIKQSQNVVKVPLQVSENNCEFILPNNVNLDEKMFCAVVDVTNAFCPEIVLSGSLNSEIENTKIESAFVPTKPEDNSVLYEEDNTEQIEALIDKNLEEDASSTYYDNCSNCKYRQAFYESGNCGCSNSSKLDNVEKSSNNIQNSNLRTPSNYSFSQRNESQNIINGNATNNVSRNNIYKENANKFVNNNINLFSNYQTNYEQNNQNFSNVPNQYVNSYNTNDNSNNIRINSNNSSTNLMEQENNFNSQNDSETFYQQIKSQLDSLFNKYPQEQNLQNIIANSKWARIDYDKENNYYVLGLIYDDNFNEVEYISYGMPSNDSSNPPEDLKEFAQWLPLEDSETKTKGYWIVYQDAKSGETIKVSFV